MIRVFCLVGLDLFLIDAVKSKLSLINELILIEFVQFAQINFVWLFCLMNQCDFDILWTLRPRLIRIGKFIGCQDLSRLIRTSKFIGCQNLSRLRNFLDVETEKLKTNETHQDWQIYWVSRLIETEKFLGCRDRDSSRLRNFLDVETETHQD